MAIPGMGMFGGRGETAGSVNVLVRFLSIGAEKIEQAMKKVGKVGDDLAFKTKRWTKSTDEYGNEVWKLTSVYKTFRMEMLGVLFFGMSLNRTFGGLYKSMRKLTIEGAFNAAQFSIMAATLSSPVWQWYQKTVWEIAAAIMGLPEPIRAVIGTGQLLLGWVGSLLESFGGLAIGIASLKLAFGSAGLVAGITSAGSAILAFITGPVGLLIIGVLAAIAVGYLLWKNWDKIKAKLTELWEKFKQTKFYEVAAAIWNRVKEVIMKVWNIIGPYLIRAWNVLKGVWSSTWNFIKRIFSAVWNNVLKPIGNLIVTIISKIVEKLQKYLGPVWDKIVGGLKIVWEALGRGLKWVWENFIKPPLDAFINILELLGEVYDKTLGKIADWFEGVTGGFKAGVESLSNWIAGLQIGGPVMQTGIYKLHKGEYVVPRGRAQNITNFGGLSPTINIYVSGEAGINEDELARRISDRMYLDMKRMVM